MKPAAHSVGLPACKRCRHLTRPGLAYPGYCDQRPDLAPAYGPGHPLNRLPADDGQSCASWAPHIVVSQEVGEVAVVPHYSEADLARMKAESGTRGARGE